MTNEAGLPVTGAAITFLNSDKFAGTATDSAGIFKIAQVPVGRYTIKVSYVGCKETIIPGCVVDAGKESVLHINLRQSVQEIDEVEITAAPQTGTSGVSTRTFTVEETQRMAATFYDPARLATCFPGVVSDNDQANNIVIRGNSPNGMLWRVEGLDIVNPNHLDNAGTFSDRAAMNGGGVNILSGQLLDNSRFITGAFSAGYGNVLSGVFDMRLRKGNNEKNEFTGQVSLLGTDLAAEGPFSKNKKSSYLVNYRYSTIGLLSAMGLDFGDEVTTFQDLSFNLSFPSQHAGSFTLFGMGGLSSTLFNGSMDSSLWQYSRDRYDVDFYSKMGAVGITHTILLGNRIALRSGAAFSGKSVQRTGNFITGDNIFQTLQKDDQEQERISLTTSATYYISSACQLTAGISSNMLHVDVFAMSAGEGQPRVIEFNGSGSYNLVQPFTDLKWSITPHLLLDAGLHYMYLSLNSSQSLEPRASLQYDLGKEKNISLAYGQHSQVQQPGVYFSTLPNSDFDIYPNKMLGFTKAHHYVAGFSTPFPNDIKLHTEAYYQQLYNVPVSANVSDPFSLLNTLEAFTPVVLVNQGTGRNYGIELSVEKFLFSKYYFLLSSTVYKSTYTALDNIERSTRYDGRYAFSFSGGKEIQRNNNKTFGFNIRTIYRGGYRETPIDVALSEASGQTVFAGEPFSIKQKDYFRIDIRFSSKKNKSRYTRTFALDIQNVTSTRNIAYRYYDTFRKEIVTKYQLGIIPVISYRVEFSCGK